MGQRALVKGTSARVSEHTEFTRGAASGLMSICKLHQLTALMESGELELDGCAHSELRNSDLGGSGEERLDV